MYRSCFSLSPCSFPQISNQNHTASSARLSTHILKVCTHAPSCTHTLCYTHIHFHAPCLCPTVPARFLQSAREVRDIAPLPPLSISRGFDNSLMVKLWQILLQWNSCPHAHFQVQHLNAAVWLLLSNRCLHARCYDAFTILSKHKQLVTKMGFAEEGVNRRKENFIWRSTECCRHVWPKWVARMWISAWSRAHWRFFNRVLSCFDHRSLFLTIYSDDRSLQWWAYDLFFHLFLQATNPEEPVLSTCMSEGLNILIFTSLSSLFRHIWLNYSNAITCHYSAA